MKAPRILVIDNYMPRPDASAGGNSMFNICKTLVEMGFKVSFLPIHNFFFEDYGKLMEREEIYPVRYSPDIPDFGTYLSRYATCYDVFHVFRTESLLGCSPYLKKYAPKATVILQLYDLDSVREGREADLLGDNDLRRQSRRSRQKEIEAAGLASCILTISEAEREILGSVSKSKSPIFCFPSLFCDAVPERVSFHETKDIFFVGGFLHRPNIDAVRYFVHDIWPDLHERLPDVNFHIVGSFLPPEVEELGKRQGIVVEGHIKDIHAFIRAMRISVAPLRYGAGIKGKVITSFGCGIPVVGTSIAMEGIPVRHRREALIADNPEKFINSIIELYANQDLWEYISMNGWNFMRERYSFEKNADQLVSIYRELDIHPEQILKKRRNNE